MANKIFALSFPGDEGEQPAVHVVHACIAAARPRHTNLGHMMRTGRWTLRSIFAGAVPDLDFEPFTTKNGTQFSSHDSLYYDN